MFFFWLFLGGSLVKDLLHDFLFPASKSIMEDTSNLDGSMSGLTVNPKYVSFSQGMVSLFKS